MAVHKHLILQTIAAHPADTHIEMTLDALIDLGAESLASSVALQNHSYGTVPRHGRAATCMVDVGKLMPFLVEDKKPAKKVTKKDEE